MKLNYTLLFALAFIANTSLAQEMLGFRTDNYNGVNGAFFNPANLADNPYKVDVNLIGVNLFAGNKNMKFDLGTFSDAGDSSGLNKLIGDNATNSIMVNLAMHLPSVSYRIDAKTSVALLTRARFLFDVRDFDGKLVNSINNQTIGLPVTINNSTNMRLNMNMFSEIGISGGRVIIDQGPHFLKAGATLKYLAGVGNYYFQLNNLNTVLDTNANGDAVARNSSGSIAMGGGLDISGSGTDIQFGFNAAGFGADLGAVYEYRPNNVAEEAMPYLFKVSVAVLDLGSIKYKAIPNYTLGYDINIPAGQEFRLENLSGSESGTELKQAFDSYPAYFKRTNGLNSSSYRVSLPRTLQLGADVRAVSHLYVSANLQLGMSNNESKPYNPKAINSFVLTPRFEIPMFAAYLPVSYNNLSKMNVGLGLRAGPLYIGSSSLLSVVTGKPKQADIYFGFRVGFRTKKDKDTDS